MVCDGEEGECPWERTFSKAELRLVETELRERFYALAIVKGKTYDIGVQLLVP